MQKLRYSVYNYSNKIKLHPPLLFLTYIKLNQKNINF